MYPFPKFNEFQKIQPTSENLTLVNPEENPKPLPKEAPVLEVKKEKKKFDWKLFLKSQNPNLSAVDEDIESGLDLLDKKIDNLSLNEKSTKCMHSFLKVTKYTFVFMFALLSLLGFALHFQEKAPEILKGAQCLFGNCNTSNSLEMKPAKISNDYNNELLNSNEKTFIYPNTFEEFKQIVNRYPKNSTLFEKEFNKILEKTKNQNE